MQEFKDKVQIRANVTQALASLSVSSLQDAAQISSALAHSTVRTVLFMITEKTGVRSRWPLCQGIQGITKGSIIYISILLCGSMPGGFAFFFRNEQNSSEAFKKCEEGKINNKKQ